MNQERKAEWLQALRSGEYGQGHKYLKQGDNNFCCLGVLCDIAIKHDEATPWKMINQEDQIYSTNVPNRVMQHSGILPPSLSKDYDLPYDVTDVLIKMNDEEGKTFEEIANYIEENL